MIRRPPRSTQSRSSAASDVYKRQGLLYRVFTAAYAEQFPSDRCLRSDRLLDILEHCISYEPGGTVLFGGRVLQLSLHDPRVDSLVSPVSAVPQVRTAVN